MAEDTCFVDCQMFGKRAETIQKYFKKGEPIFVEGRLKFDSWQAQDGTKKSKLRVFVENFEFVGRGGQKAAPSAASGADEMPPQDLEPPFGAGGNDDIPF